MKTQLALLTLTAGLFAGCATPQIINWDSRVGTYRYDQAVKDYGTPDKLAKLTDGRKAAEWYLGYGQRVLPNLSPVLRYEYYIGALNTGRQNYEINLHLTFATNDILAAWSQD